MNMSEILTDTGLNLPANCSEDEFFEVGHLLSTIVHGTQWAIGDWYNAIPWGDKEAACDKADLNYDTAIKYGAVCSIFKNRKIFQKLTFDHGIKLLNQDLTVIQRTEWLEKSRKNEWSANKMVKEIKAEALALAPPKPVEHQLTIDKAVHEALEGLPKSATNKVKKGIKKVYAKLQVEFDEAVDKSAAKQTEAIRISARQLEAQARDEKDTFRKLNLKIDQIMSQDEFKLILSCLHPDRLPEDQQAKYNKAFNIFKRLTDSIHPGLTDKVKAARGWK